MRLCLLGSWQRSSSQGTILRSGNQTPLFANAGGEMGLMAPQVGSVPYRVFGSCAHQQDIDRGRRDHTRRSRERLWWSSSLTPALMSSSVINPSDSHSPRLRLARSDCQTNPPPVAGNQISDTSAPFVIFVGMNLLRQPGVVAGDALRSSHTCQQIESLLDARGCLGQLPVKLRSHPRGFFVR
jgi:hypothetical protein